MLTERALPLDQGAGLLPRVDVGGAVPQVAAGFGWLDAGASADAGLARFLVHGVVTRLLATMLTIQSSPRCGLGGLVSRAAGASPISVAGSRRRRVGGPS